MYLSVTQQPVRLAGITPDSQVRGRILWSRDLSELGFGFRYAVLEGLYNQIFFVFLRNHEDPLANMMVDMMVLLMAHGMPRLYTVSVRMFWDEISI